jgi:4'-phosphopantetheinyl transferase
MPEAGTCRVWWARRNDLRTGHVKLLSALEQARRSGYARAADRDRFTLAAALLRLVVAGEVGVAPDRLRIDRDCPCCTRPHGRPRLPGHDLHVSVSHSGELVAVAATSAGPVGVDVEQITDLDYLSMCRHVLAPSEMGAVRSREDFFRYWTRKESVLKATGDGLRTAMTTVVLGPDAGHPTLLRYGTREGLVATIADLLPVEGYAAAVAVLVPGPVRVAERTAADLLADR